MRLLWQYFICTMIALGLAPLKAAEFKNEGVSWSLNGPIVPGDTQKLQILTKDLNSLSHVLLLNSTGGSFSEAIKLARLVREASLATVIRKGSQCLSACALVFLAGGNDYDGPQRLLEIGGALGFHSPYIDTQQTVENASTFSRSVIEAMKEITELFEHFNLSKTLTSTLMPNRADRALKMIDDLYWTWELGISLVVENKNISEMTTARFQERYFYKPGKVTKKMAENLCYNSARLQNKPRKGVLPPAKAGYDDPLETGRFIETKDRIFFPGAVMTDGPEGGEGQAVWCFVFQNGKCDSSEQEFYRAFSLNELLFLQKIDPNEPPFLEPKDWKWERCSHDGDAGREFMAPSETKLSEVDGVLRAFEKGDTPVGELWEKAASLKMEWQIVNDSNTPLPIRWLSYSRIRGYRLGAEGVYTLAPHSSISPKLTCKSGELLCLRKSPKMTCDNGEMGDGFCCQYCSATAVSTRLK